VRPSRTLSSRARALLALAALVLPWIAATALPWVATTAHADEGAGESATDAETVGALVLILGVGAAYLLAHAVVDRMQRRFLVLTGAEYVLLGMLLGPVVAPGLRAFETLDPVLPLVALAAGWVGLLRGMELHLRDVTGAGAQRGASRVALAQAMVCGPLVAGAAWVFFSAGWTDASEENIALGAGVLGCVAATAALRPIEIVVQRYSIEGGLAPLVRRIAALSDLIAIVAFGVLVCVFHPQPEDAPARASATEWVVISAGLGVALGVLFTPFLGGDDSDHGRFLALVGIITFASGAAYFLQISPIFVNLCLGAVLVNASRSGPQIRATLESTRGPMALILLVFAGALFRPPPLVPTLFATVGLVALRLVGKAIGCALAARGTELRPDLHRGLLAQGDVAVAIAVAYRVFHLEGAIADVVFASVLASRVLHDLVAPRALRKLLVDAGDVRAEAPPARPTSDPAQPF
jgi:Kef-type K+ transport system membrane component KefB